MKVRSYLDAGGALDGHSMPVPGGHNAQDLKSRSLKQRNCISFKPAQLVILRPEVQC